MHIGKNFEQFKCQPLYVDNWKKIETENSEIEDVCIGTELMEEKDDEKYLGDVICKDGRNLKNIQARVNKGKRIIRKILEVLGNYISRWLLF